MRREDRSINLPPNIWRESGTAYNESIEVGQLIQFIKADFGTASLRDFHHLVLSFVVEFSLDIMIQG